MAPKKSCKGGACKRKTPVKRPSTARKPATPKRKTVTPKRPSTARKPTTKKTATPKRTTAPSATRKVITQLTPYYTSTQLSSMSRSELVRICKSSNMKGYSNKSVPELKKMILERQNSATRTSKFVTVTSLERLKDYAREEGVSTSGTRQDILDRIHKKRGMF